MILMDTCAIIWDALAREKLSKNAEKAINQADKNQTLMIADISLWEIAMLISKGRLQINSTAANFIQLYLQTRDISVQAITPEIADLSTSFGTAINKDPADRIIAATSIIKNAQLVTADENLLSNELLDTVW